MQFTITLDIGEGRARRYSDIVRILRELARHLLATMGRRHPIDRPDKGEIRDTNGAVVGKWSAGEPSNRLCGLTEVAAEQIVSSTREKWASEDLEIDDSPTLSVGDDPGCWVSAWVWVPFSDAEICESCHEDNSDDHRHCSTETCDTSVSPDDLYSATPCGTFCNECMAEHAKECSICASEFDL